MNDTITKAELFDEIKQRYDSSDGNVQISRQELETLGVLRERGFGDRLTVDNEGPVVAKGRKDIDPVKYYLCRINSEMWVALKCLYNLIDSDPQWYVTGVGDVTVDAKPLDSEFGDDIDIPTETIQSLQEVYQTYAEERFDYVDELYGVVFDGSTIHMELEEPWIMWDEIANEHDIDEETWEHEVKPAMTDARPSNARILNTDLITEYAVDVSFV